MERYKIIKNIGDGTYGSVVKASNLKNGEIVAIKKMKKKFQSWEECMSLREIKSLRKISHPNIIKLKEVIKLHDELYLVFEYLEHNLFQYYQSHKERNIQIPEKTIKLLIHQILLALAHMHKHGFFHRDLKPENLLVHSTTLKVCDFGLAREVRSRPPYTDYVSTRWYRAPEILLKSTNYNSPIDIFALGCIMAELYNLNPLFPGNSQMDQLYKICAILGTPAPNAWKEGYKLAAQIGFTFPTFNGVPLKQAIPSASPEAIDIMQEMMRFCASKRPTAQQLLQNPYFNSLAPMSRGVTPQKNLRDATSSTLNKLADKKKTLESMKNVNSDLSDLSDDLDDFSFNKKSQGSNKKIDVPKVNLDNIRSNKNNDISQLSYTKKGTLDNQYEEKKNMFKNLNPSSKENFDMMKTPKEYDSGNGSKMSNDQTDKFRRGDTLTKYPRISQDRKDSSSPIGGNYINDLYRKNAPDSGLGQIGKKNYNMQGNNPTGNIIGGMNYNNLGYNVKETPSSSSYSYQNRLPNFKPVYKEKYNDMLSEPKIGLSAGHNRLLQGMSNRNAHMINKYANNNYGVGASQQNYSLPPANKATYLLGGKYNQEPSYRKKYEF